MKFYTYTKKENVLKMQSKGIEKGMVFYASLEACKNALITAIDSDVLKPHSLMAIIGIEFDDNELEHIIAETYTSLKEIDKSRVPKLINIPLFEVTKAE